MKKLLAIIFTLFITMSAFSSSSAVKVGEAAGGKAVPGSIKCYKCISYWKRTGIGCWGCMTINRDVVAECNPKNKGFHVYRCPHGHTLYVSYDGKTLK